MMSGLRIIRQMYDHFQMKIIQNGMEEGKQLRGQHGVLMKSLVYTNKP